MWIVLGTGAPTSLHVAQIYHLIWRTLNASTCRHTRRRHVLADFSSRAQGAWLVVSCRPGGGRAAAGSESGDQGVQDNVRRGPGGGRLG